MLYNRQKTTQTAGVMVLLEIHRCQQKKGRTSRSHSLYPRSNVAAAPASTPSATVPVIDTSHLNGHVAACRGRHEKCYLCARTDVTLRSGQGSAKGNRGKSKSTFPQIPCLRRVPFEATKRNQKSPLVFWPGNRLPKFGRRVARLARRSERGDLGKVGVRRQRSQTG